MKNTIFTLTISMLFFGLIAQDDTRNLDNFEELSVSGGIKVELVQGDTPKAEIDILKGELDNLVTEVDGDELKIYFSRKGKKWGWGSNNGQARIKLYFVGLTDIDASAGSTVEGEDVIRSKDFDIDVSSGSRVKVHIETGDIDVDVSSGARVDLKGFAIRLDVSVSSGASFRGEDLEVKEVDASASSGGSARVWATNKLDANASSGGSVKYKGNPQEVDIDSGKYSGGSITKM